MALTLVPNSDSGTVAVSSDVAFTVVQWKPTVSSTWQTMYSGSPVTSLVMHPPAAISWDFQANVQGPAAPTLSTASTGGTLGQTLAAPAAPTLSSGAVGGTLGATAPAPTSPTLSTATTGGTLGQQLTAPAAPSLSVAPTGGTVGATMNPPSAPVLSTAMTGGAISGGTYQAQSTLTNAQGETLASGTATISTPTLAAPASPTLSTATTGGTIGQTMSAPAAPVLSTATTGGTAGAQIAAPAAPTLSTATTGGTVLAGVYQCEVSLVNAAGETTGSTSASITTTGTTSTITITAPTAAGDATGWYAYVTQVGGSTYTRQQAAGSPTALGTNLVITAPPTSTGAAPPGANTAWQHYALEISYVNPAGETVASASASITPTTATSTITVTAPAASANATAYYVYCTQAGSTSYTRQQTAGSPTAIGTNYVISAAPTNTGVAPPGANTAWLPFAVEITYTSANGETVASASASVTPTTATSTITITSPAASTGATNWYAYVTQANGTSYIRQQAAGSPTAIGTNLVLTATPTSTGATPPATNTATTNTNTITVTSPASAATATGWYAYLTLQGSSTTRQQTAGSPTAIGTNLVLTANPTTTGAHPPSVSSAWLPYGVEVSLVNPAGETTGSASASITPTTATSILTVVSPAAAGDATGYYVYMTQPGGASYTRQQTAGSPTAIGTNLQVSAPPTATGAAPPGSNTAWEAYRVEIGYVTAAGESLPSTSAGITPTTATSTITITSPAASSGVTGWYAYVTQPGGTSYTRQQVAGSPTAIGTNLVLSSAPTNTGAAPQASSSAWLAYAVEVSLVNAAGETVASASSSITPTSTTSSITITSPATVATATGWYAYVTQPGGSSYTRQQIAGSPSLMGANLTLSAAPTNTGAAPPGSNTAWMPYSVEIAYVTAGGESAASISAGITPTSATSTLTIASPASSTGATGWYAYVTQAGGSMYTRQQAAGSPTAIGTALVLTAPPTTNGAVTTTGGSIWSQATVLLTGRGMFALPMWINDTANMSSGLALGGVINWTDLQMDYLETESVAEMYGRQTPVSYYAATNYLQTYSSMQFFHPASFQLSSGTTVYGLNDMALLESFRGIYGKTLLVRDPQAHWLYCKLSKLSITPESNVGWTVKLQLRQTDPPATPVY